MQNAKEVINATCFLLMHSCSYTEKLRCLMVRCGAIVFSDFQFPCMLKCSFVLLSAHSPLNLLGSMSPCPHFALIFQHFPLHVLVCLALQVVRYSCVAVSYPLLNTKVSCLFVFSIKFKPYT